MSQRKRSLQLKKTVQNAAVTLTQNHSSSKTWRDCISWMRDNVTNEASLTAWAWCWRSMAIADGGTGGGCIAACIMERSGRGNNVLRSDAACDIAPWSGLDARFYTTHKSLCQMNARTTDTHIHISHCNIFHHTQKTFTFQDIFHDNVMFNCHTHPFTGTFPGLPRWAGTRKVKPIWILLEQETVSSSGISWATCNSAPRSRQTTMPAPHHSVFLQAGCPSCRPTISVKALKALMFNCQQK